MLKNMTDIIESYWDFLPDDLQERCYEINHKRAMGEILKEMKERCFSNARWDGLGGWVYSLRLQLLLVNL